MTMLVLDLCMYNNMDAHMLPHDRFYGVGMCGFRIFLCRV